MAISNYRQLTVWAESAEFVAPEKSQAVLQSVEEVGRMLHALHAKLKSPSP